MVCHQTVGQSVGWSIPGRLCLKNLFTVFESRGMPLFQDSYINIKNGCVLNSSVVKSSKCFFMVCIVFWYSSKLEMVLINMVFYLKYYIEPCRYSDLVINLTIAVCIYNTLSRANEFVWHETDLNKIKESGKKTSCPLQQSLTLPATQTIQTNMSFQLGFIWDSCQLCINKIRTGSSIN